MKPEQLTLLTILNASDDAHVTAESIGAGEPVHVRIVGTLDIEHGDLDAMVIPDWIALDGDGRLRMGSNGERALATASAVHSLMLIRALILNYDFWSGMAGSEEKASRALDRAVELATAAEPAPLPMILHCPRCATQHVDAPEPENGWTNPPHKSHQCKACGCVWRPADVPTVGVARIETKGEADNWSPPAESDGPALIRLVENAGR